MPKYQSNFYLHGTHSVIVVIPAPPSYSPSQLHLSNNILYLQRLTVRTGPNI